MWNLLPFLPFDAFTYFSDWQQQQQQQQQGRWLWNVENCQGGSDSFLLLLPSLTMLPKLKEVFNMLLTVYDL
jgi:hypothetical protein